MRDERRNYVLVGLLVVTMTAALLWWLATLAGRTGPTDAYPIRYRNVMGLIDGAQVLFEGYPVGVIEQIVRVDEPGDPHFRVDAAIRRGWQIPVDSEAEITSANLLGGVVIDIRAGSSPVSLEPGDQIPSREAANVFA
ncbi:MAG: MlaD family protein, partial [Gammaproteobacteria bacterium]